MKYFLAETGLFDRNSAASCNYMSSPHEGATKTNSNKQNSFAKLKG